MGSDVRQRMIEGAMGLLSRGGTQAASFSDVLNATGAPRGSIYHHFPSGKRELMDAAVDQAGAILIGALEQLDGASPQVVVEGFLSIWRTLLVRSQCAAGCAVAAVAVGAETTEQRDHVAQVFKGWISRLTDLLQKGGAPQQDAHVYAIMLVASVEGAVVLSRAEASLDPFEAVASQLIAQAKALPRV